MSIECGECERDLRGGHAPDCSRTPRNCLKLLRKAHPGYEFSSSDGVAFTRVNDHRRRKWRVLGYFRSGFDVLSASMVEIKRVKEGSVEITAHPWNAGVPQNPGDSCTYSAKGWSGFTGIGNLMSQCSIVVEPGRVYLVTIEDVTPEKE